jgi:RNase P/RNase MRP subunit p29
VQVRGYWEDGEFKAAQVTRLADGQTIALRDELGRPAWAGAGRNAKGGQSSYGGQGREDVPGDQAGVGEADVKEWLTIQGAVVSVDANTLVVQADSGEQVAVEKRAWWFAQEQGFSAQVGDQVTLVGFYEGDDFEVGQIEDAANGQTVLVRDENGRPLWAGRGRRGG